jgi:hypothetical protein
MAPRYPFFAGVAGVVIPGVAALAGFACAGAFAAGPCGAISALIVNRNVCTPAFLSSCLASLISIFWKYPLQRGNEVRYRIRGRRSSLQCQLRALLGHGRQPKILCAGNRVRHLIQQFLASGAVPLQLLNRLYPLLKHDFLLIECLDLQLDLLQFRLLCLQLLNSLVLVV